ncbi:MAG: twin-arginine translocation signal domain-containing protein, partial [Pyrinomonadaceae bacterium]|nr:twin-arginine translocation signal domain-containing protein [Pyrinomonadaceae bacterium]
MENSRRSFLRRSSLFGAAGLLASSKVVSAQHEGHVMPQPQTPPQTHKKPDNRSPASAGQVLVHAPDVPKLPWTMDNGVKVFRLDPEVVKVQLIPGKEMYAWGYSGSVP